MVGNRRGDASRAALLRAGKSAFSSQRYEEVSIVDLARSLGVAAGSISYHFGGKRGFYLAVLEHAAEEFWGDLLALRGPALDRLNRGVDRLLDEAEHQPRAFEALFADVADAEVREIRDRRKAQLTEALMVEVTGADSSPVLRAGLSGFVSFIEGLVLHWMRTREISREQVKELVVGNLFGTVLAALRSDPSIELAQRAIDATLSDPQIAAFLGPLSAMSKTTE